MPASLPDCPSGFMWVAVPHSEKASVAGVCEMEQSDVPEMLPVLESGVFVEPLPDQIAVVYEYGEVQVHTYKEVIAGKTREFFFDPNDFPILSDSAGLENKNHLCDIEYSQEKKPDVFADARVLVPGVNNSIKVVRANVHPKWPAFAVRIALENQCYVVLEPWGTAGDWGVCVCCSSYKKKTVWVDRDDHFTNKGHAKAVWHFPVTEVPSRHRGNPFDIHFSASRGQDERINASSGDFLARHQSVNLIGSSGRSPDIVVFYPSACQACDVMDGAFIIDSYM